jgi:hypothetical protein
VIIHGDHPVHGQSVIVTAALFDVGQALACEIRDHRDHAAITGRITDAAGALSMNVRRCGRDPALGGQDVG